MKQEKPDREIKEDRVEKDHHPPDRLSPSERRKLYPDRQIRRHPNRGDQMAEPKPPPDLT